MQILVIIFRDMQKYLVGKQADSASQLYLIWEFAYKVMPLYLWVVVWDKPVTEFPAATSTSSTTPERMLYYDDDYDSTLSTVEALAHSVLEWLSVLTSMSGLFTIIRISIHLLVNVFFHFMMMT